MAANEEFILRKKTVDDWLNDVDYKSLNLGNYRPSLFALKMMNFIKLVNGTEGEANTTPVVHLAMLDKIQGPGKRVANLCHRGLGKTTLMFEYLSLYLAIFGEIDGFGKVDGMIYVSDSMDNGVKTARKNIEHRFFQSEFLQEWIPEYKFTDPYLEFISKNNTKIGIKMFGAKTGIRGTKIFGKRPVLAVLDDLVSDEDAKSQANMEAIKHTVGRGVLYALDPTRYKMVFNGTPFNKGDVLYEAVESGVWDVNVWPVCEKFPVPKSEFRGSWEDRFTYDYVKDQYEAAIEGGKLADFNQELMLRISSPDERMIQDEEIARMWYPRQILLQNKHQYNFYITTDFATKAKQSSDYSVISVWAYSNAGHWFWVDGMLAKQTMDKNIDRLFKFVSEYNPISVGIETSGQQGAFIQWLQGEMLTRNIWFSIAMHKGQLGISPTTDKLSRFNEVLPQIKAGMIHFPQELKDSAIMGEFISEMEMASITGFKSKHDDAIDTISMLMYMNPYKPSEQASLAKDDSTDMWNAHELNQELHSSGSLSSYIV